MLDFVDSSHQTCVLAQASLAAEKTAFEYCSSNPEKCFELCSIVSGLAVGEIRVTKPNLSFMLFSGSMFGKTKKDLKPPALPKGPVLVSDLRDVGMAFLKAIDLGKD